MLAKKGSVSGAGSRRGSGLDGRRASYAFTATTAVEDSVYVLKGKLATMKEDLVKSQESFISRERAYRTRISELEEEFSRIKQRKTGWMRADGSLSELRAVHGRINDNVELVQGRTTQIVAAQETFIVNTFRSRLFEIQAELEKEKGKSDDGSIGWIDKSHQLEAQVESLKESSDLVERLNQALVVENSELARRIRDRDGDRADLIATLGEEKDRNISLQEELVTLRKEHGALEEQVKRLQDELLLLGGGAGTALPRLSHHGSVHQLGTAQENEERQREANKRVRRLLADERYSLVIAQQNYAQELGLRTDLELLLRGCAETVGRDIAKRRIASQRLDSSTPTVPEYVSGNSPLPLSEIGKKAYSVLHKEDNLSDNLLVVPPDQFTKADRDRILEMMLADPVVVTQLCARRRLSKRHASRPGSPPAEPGDGELPTVGPDIAQNE